MSRIAYRAVKAGIGETQGSLVVFDTGGGSSQFTFGQGDSVEERFSINVGAVRFTERFDLDRVVPDEVLEAAFEAIAADLARLGDRPAPDMLVGMGGAVANLAAVNHRLAAYDPDIVQGSMLDRREIDRQIELYRGRTSDQRRQIIGLQPKRAEVILAGACIVRTILTKLGSDSLTVSDRGLRHGLLIERLGAGPIPRPVCSKDPQGVIGRCWRTRRSHRGRVASNRFDANVAIRHPPTSYGALHSA